MKQVGCTLVSRIQQRLAEASRGRRDSRNVPGDPVVQIDPSELAELELRAQKLRRIAGPDSPYRFVRVTPGIAGLKRAMPAALVGAREASDAKSSVRTEYAAVR